MSNQLPRKMSTLAPCLFVSHGTALHTMDEGSLVNKQLRSEGALLLSSFAPRAIIIFSAHWFGSTIGISSASEPKTVHDHPTQYLASFKYRARGDPALAKQVASALQAQGFKTKLEPTRGLDHGAWLALASLFPTAPVPIVQVALSADADPDRNFSLGLALAPFRASGVMIVGSGGVTHNQDEFRREFLARFSFQHASDGSPLAVEARRKAMEEAPVAAFSRKFDRWIETVLTTSPVALLKCIKLIASSVFEAKNPGEEKIQGRLAHPEPSHIIPLFAVLGAWAGPVTDSSSSLSFFSPYSPSLSSLSSSFSNHSSSDSSFFPDSSSSLSSSSSSLASSSSPLSCLSGKDEEDQPRYRCLKVVSGFQYSLSMTAFKFIGICRVEN